MKSYIMNIIGTLCMGIGISLLIDLNQGVDTISMMYLGVQKHFEVEVWQLCFLLNIMVVIIVFFIDRSHIGKGTIINFIGLTLFLKILPPALLTFTSSLSPVFAHICVLLGTLFLAIGCGVYAKANIGSAAFEALSGVLSKKLDIKLRYIRIGLDVTAVLVGIILGASIGIGTLLCVLCVGPISQKVMEVLN